MTIHIMSKTAEMKCVFSSDAAVSIEWSGASTGGFVAYMFAASMRSQLAISTMSVSDFPAKQKPFALNTY